MGVAIMDAIPYSVPDMKSIAAVGALLMAAGAAASHALLAIIKSQKGRRILRETLADDKSTDEKPKPVHGDEPLVDALLSFVHRLEESNAQDREERRTQWAKVEKMEQAIHGQSVILSGAVEKFAQSQNGIAQAVTRLEQSQNQLATHIYQHLSQRNGDRQ